MKQVGNADSSKGYTQFSMHYGMKTGALTLDVSIVSLKPCMFKVTLMEILWIALVLTMKSVSLALWYSL